MSDVKPNLIYVSAFMEVADRPPLASTDLEGYVDQFVKLASTDIPIILYICPLYHDIFGSRLVAYPNVECIVVSLEESWTHHIFHEKTYALPSGRNPSKDSLDYITLQHSKIEWVANALYHRPAATHAAWVDFRLPHVFKSAAPLKDLKTYTESDWLTGLDAGANAGPLYIPGCLSSVAEPSLHHPHWRFCGGFFLGSRDRLMDFWERTLRHLPTWLSTYRVAAWEVNFWAWLESAHSWLPTWYAADHNDSIVQIKPPLQVITKHGQPQSLQCSPLEDPRLHPMNTSYVKHRGFHVLNIRYVNYRMDAGGVYDTSVLHTSNVCSILDTSYNAFISRPMSNALDMTSYPTNIFGLEDIRLFVHADKLHAIGTQRQWSPCGRNRMVLGIYEPHTGSIHECRLLSPPTDTPCEKNWIPVPATGSDQTSPIQFIYKWHPYSVGTVDAEGKLQLHTIEDYGPALHGLRGSAVPVLYQDSLWALVHRSGALKYTHSFVLLDPATLRPMATSQEFVFESVGVEYCIGFTVEGDEGLFWYSRQDSKPHCVRVLMSTFRTKKIRVPM